MPPTNQAWVELMRKEPARFLTQYNKEYPNIREIMMETECSQSTAYKLGLIAVKAYREKLKANAGSGDSGVGKVAVG